jgi:hypothetical protein
MSWQRDQQRQAHDAREGEEPHEAVGTRSRCHGKETNWHIVEAWEFDVVLGNSAELHHHCHPIMPNLSGAKVTNSNTRPPMDARQSSSRAASSLTMAAAVVLRHSRAKLANSVKVTADLVVHVFGVLRQSLMDHQSCLHPSSHPDAKWQAP